MIMNYRDKYKTHLLKNEVLKLNLPEEFDIERVVTLLKKKFTDLWIFYPHSVGNLAQALDELVKEGTLKSRLFSKKMTDGSKTELLYIK